jgi:DNA-binding CsgD family transcriptional regulator
VADDIIGRDPEIASLVSFLDETRSRATAIVLEGTAGIGKTTLWKWGCAEARSRGYRVLASRPAQSEASLSFAALSDLLGGVMDNVIASLPPPQHRALDVALLRAEPSDAVPDQRAVSMATLEAVRLLSGAGPVLLAVDDIQWLDTPSARVLEFAIRRLANEPVGVLLAVRVGRRPARAPDLERAMAEDRVSRYRVGPLSVAALHHVLETRLDVLLARSTLLRVHEASGGNPLFALELARALAERGAAEPETEALPIPESLHRLVEARIARLPTRTREALLAAAALSSPTLSLVDRAVGPASLVRAIGAGVVEADGDRIRFAHPLLASVVYSEASVEERRRMHRRLAEVVIDVEQRARHLALGSAGPDARVASALEDAARIARSRGAVDAAAELFELAARLTPAEEADLARVRKVEAATSREVVGDVGRARELLEQAVAGWPPGPDRARALIVLARAVDSDVRGAELLEQAQQEAEGDQPLTATIRVSRAWNVLSHRFDPVAAEPHATAALAAAVHLGDEWLLSRSLSVAGIVDFLLGGTEALPLLQRAVGLESASVPLGVVRQPSYCLSNVLRWMDQFDAARDRLEWLRHLALELGGDASLYDILFELCELECWAGRYETARSYAEGMDEVAGMVGWAGSWAASARAMVEAHLGREQEVHVAAERALETTALHGDTRVHIKLLATLGFLAISQGDAALARSHLDRAAELTRNVREPSVMRFAADHIEALIAVGDVEDAGRHLDRLQAHVEARDRPWAAATAGRCRGLLLAATGQLQEAVQAMEGALKEHERLPMPLELGRTLLAQGEVRRRMRHKAAANRSLESALAIFEDLGAALWAERARTALRRVGLRPAAPLDLTETEKRVADLAAAGKTNRQIAQSLFVSPKTVEANLARVYRKLGVGSKAELAALVAARPSGDRS